MAISKIQDFSAGSKFAIKLPQAISNESLLMTEKVKTVIECFFCYPLVKSRGQPNHTSVDLSVGSWFRKSFESPFILNVVLRKHMCCFYVAIYDSISYSTKWKIYDLSEIYSKAIDSVNVFLGNRSFFGNTCT